MLDKRPVTKPSTVIKLVIALKLATNKRLVAYTEYSG